MAAGKVLGKCLYERAEINFYIGTVSYRLLKMIVDCGRELYHGHACDREID